VILARKPNIAGCEWMFLGGSCVYTGWQNYHITSHIFIIYIRNLCLATEYTYFSSNINIDCSTTAVARATHVVSVSVDLAALRIATQCSTFMGSFDCQCPMYVIMSPQFEHNM
jgi:hypothetical protein